MLTILPPDWGQSTTPDHLTSHYGAVAEHMPMMLITDIFSPRGLDFGLRRLRQTLDQVQGVMAIKDDFCGEFARKMGLLVHDPWAVWVRGPEAESHEAHPCGCDGYLSSFLSCHPATAYRYWEAIETGDLSVAKAIIRDVDMPFFDHIKRIEGGFDAAVHGILELIGVAGRWRPLPFHIQLDVFEEERLGGQAFGSTRVGIAPFYADKYMKAGVQAGDFFDETWLRERVERCLVSRNVLFRHLYGQPVVESDSIITSLLTHANRLRSMICDAAALLHERLAADETVLVEDQLGALRNPDHGIYPYSTSSSTLAGFAAVGAGPFVTEWSGAQAEQLRQRGGGRGEFGATTGRPRRAGPFNAVATRYGCRLQGASRVALTNLDVFS